MPIIDKAAIPGWLEAVERETAARRLAFTPLKERICGIDVEPLTPFRMLLLESIKSPFVTAGGFIGRHDLVNFLWAVSPDYSPARTFATWRAKRALRCAVERLDLEVAAEACADYIESAWMDAPPTREGTGGQAHVEFVGYIVHALASNYGWPEADILNCPLKRLWQYFALIRVAKNEHATLHSPSDRIVNAWIVKQNEETRRARGN